MYSVTVNNLWTIVWGGGMVNGGHLRQLLLYQHVVVRGTNLHDFIPSPRMEKLIQDDHLKKSDDTKKVIRSRKSKNDKETNDLQNTT